MCSQQVYQLTDVSEQVKVWGPVGWCKLRSMIKNAENVQKGWHGGTAGSAAASQLHGPWFDLELLSACCFACSLRVASGFSGFLLLSQKHVGRRTGYAKLSVGMNECVNVCVWSMVTAISFRVNSPCAHSSQMGSGPTVALTRIKWLLYMNERKMLEKKTTHHNAPKQTCWQITFCSAPLPEQLCFAQSLP